MTGLRPEERRKVYIPTAQNASVRQHRMPLSEPSSEPSGFHASD